MTNPPQKIALPNSPAYISYLERPQNGDGGAETALVNGSEIIVLNGDFRSDIKKMIRGVRFPYLSVCKWFKTKEKEWGSSWSAGSSIQTWKLMRGID